MINKMPSTSHYTILEETKHGRIYCFYCDYSGIKVYTTKPVQAENPTTELRLAWEEARVYFNGCSECGKWICDKAYNIDEMKCIGCAPYSKERNCPKCGGLVSFKNSYCINCGYLAPQRRY